MKIVKKLGMVSLVMSGILSFAQADNLAEFEKKCTSGDGDACATLGAIYSGLSGKSSVQKDIKKATAYWKKGCELNSGSACTTYSMVIEDDNERIKLLKKACDLGNENGCLAYDQTVMMQELQVECVDQGNVRSCRKIAGELFVTGDYAQGKELMGVVCEMGDKTACNDQNIISQLKGFTKLSLIEELKKECSDKKDKYACDKAGSFLISISDHIASSAKTKADIKHVLPEVMTDLSIGQLYIKEACILGRKESCRTLKGLEAAQKKNKGGQ